LQNLYYFYAKINSTSRHVASLRDGLTRKIYIGPVVVGDVGDNGVNSYRLHASETQQLSYTLMADATAIRYLCGVAIGQLSANDGPTCNAL